MSKDYTFKQECDVCDGEPVMKDTGMCGVCSTGTADALWDWLDEDWSGEEGKLAADYLTSIFRDGIAPGPSIRGRVREILTANVSKPRLFWLKISGRI